MGSGDVNKPFPQNFAITRQQASKASLRQIAIPPLLDEYILVETVTVALNPTDWTTLDAPGALDTVVGCDYAGIVLVVGAGVTKSFQVGDRVAGIAHGANDAAPWMGAFGRIIAVKGDLQIKIPSNISWEEACTVGVATCTAGWALWKVLGLQMPNPQAVSSGGQNDPSRPWILIYGGSTSTGTIAIQFAKLSGHKVITTASPKHFELLQNRGADVVLDYRMLDVGERINQYTNNSLCKILDCVSTDSTAAQCAKAFGSLGGIYCNLLGVQCARPDVKSVFFLGYSISGESYIFESDKYNAQPEFLAFGKQYLDVVEKLWEKGLFKVHPQWKRAAGLNGIIDGMQAMREGRVSGAKLVYRVSETDWSDNLQQKQRH